MVARAQIIFALAVAVAGFQQLARPVDAQPLDGVARPAAAVALAREPLLRRQHRVGVGRDVALEIGLAAEQAEAVLDLPLDGRSGVRLGKGRHSGAGREQRGCQAQRDEKPHDRRHDKVPINWPIHTMPVWAEIRGPGHAGIAET